MKIKEAQKVLTAMADETRLRIIHLLSAGELCVCDLMSVLKEPQSKVSRHLAFLRKNQVVKARREGLWMYYQLSHPSSKMLKTMLKAVKFGPKDFKQLKKDLITFRASKNGLVACCK